MAEDLERYRLLEQSLRESSARARDAAREARHARVDVAHLARTLLDVEDVQRAVRACGAEHDDVLAVVLGTMDELPRSGVLGRLLPARESEALGRVYQQALSDAYQGYLTDIDPLALLVAIVSAEPTDLLGQRLDALGLEPLPLMRFAAHGTVHEQALPGGTGPCRLVVDNDPYTPFSFVIDVLETHFELDRVEAGAFATTVHLRGHADLPLDDRVSARRAVEEVRALARESCFPLAITIR